MTDRERISMNEQEFEAMLRSSVAELPPEEIVAGVTPWKKAMKRVLAGMALCTVTLRFGGLDLSTVFPALGIVLLLLGFRALCRENKWFQCCFITTIFRTVSFFFTAILKTTILYSTVLSPQITQVLGMIGLPFLFVEILCFRNGLRAVQKKAGLPPRAGGALALLVWYGLVCVLAAIQSSELLLIMVIMLVAYFFILRSLYLLSKELDEAGYAVQTAFLKIPDRFFACSIALALVLGCTLGYLFGGSYPMEWRAVEQSEHREVEEIKTSLLELGFPDYVLNDLTPEDIAACDGAVQVIVDVTDEPVNEGRRVSREGKEGEQSYTWFDTVYDVKELRLTGVAVQLPGRRETWMIFHHFLWTTDPGFYGTESIQLWPTYRNVPEGWAPAGEVTGRILYDRAGETLSAPYYFLGAQTFISQSVFWGVQENTDVFAAFSMPAGGEQYRGYVAYPAAEAQNGYIITSWMNYTHQKSWMQYPAVTAMETRMANNRNDAGIFQTVQNAFQFYATDEGVEIIG
ncbi:MAG: hypothetical protein J1E06_06925 [Acutalibacter sp.]|nr:hypothetical protein [Acutalibacter sp.]